MKSTSYLYWLLAGLAAAQDAQPTTAPAAEAGSVLQTLTVYGEAENDAVIQPPFPLAVEGTKIFAGTRATIITSQLPVEHWHAWIGDATIADAILDRLLSRSHRLALKGKSLRPQRHGAATAATGGSATADAAR
jgi:hypothetical protein